jgi:carbonic anhydrase
MRTLILLSFLFSSALATAPWYPPSSGGARAAEWHYGEENEWAAGYPECAGSRQSPVALVTEDAEKSNVEFLRIHQPISPAVPLPLINNGHTIQLNIADLTPTPRPIFVASSISPYIYEVIQIHFHGASEHTVNGAYAPMEIHVVCQVVDRTAPARGSRIPTIVLGYLYKVGDKADPLLADILSSPLPEEGATQTRTMFPIIPRQRKYFHYQGSFTTPPCTEVVEWLVGSEMLTATQAQINAFLDKFPHEDPLGNARHIQPLNGRTVKIRTFTQDPLSTELQTPTSPSSCPGGNVVVQVGN